MKRLSLYRGLKLAMVAIIFSGAASGQVDPTKPAVSLALQNPSSNQTNDALMLQSILKRQNSLIAVISGQSYRVGELVGEHRIVQINSNDVVLNDGRQTMTLKMNSYEIKK